MKYFVPKKIKQEADIFVQDEEGLKNKKSIWGVAPLFPLHLGFDPLINIQKKLIKCGYNHTVIIFDTAFFLENEIRDVNKKTDYYIELLSLLGLERGNFVIASDYQYRKDFWEIIYDISRHSTQKGVIKASPFGSKDSCFQLTDFLHIIFQVSDIVFHNASLVVGDSGQKRVYDEGRKLLRKAGFTDPAEVLVRLPKDLKGRALVDSSSSTRISYHESEHSLEKKIDSLQFENKNVLYNLFVNSVFPYKSSVKFDGESLNLKKFKTLFGDINEELFDKMRDTLYNILNERLDRIKKYFEKNPDLIEWIDFKRVRGKV